MIVDSSAVVACILRDPGCDLLVDAIGAAPAVAIGAPTAIETGVVLVSRMGVAGKTLLARFLAEASIEILPVTAAHWTVAVDAYARFGRGRHGASLSFGDCLTYAVARVAGRPLLCIGSDFSQTDLELAPIGMS